MTSAGDASFLVDDLLPTLRQGDSGPTLLARCEELCSFWERQASDLEWLQRLKPSAQADEALHRLADPELHVALDQAYRSLGVDPRNSRAMTNMLLTTAKSIKRAKARKGSAPLPAKGMTGLRLAADIGGIHGQICTLAHILSSEEAEQPSPGSPAPVSGRKHSRVERSITAKTLYTVAATSVPAAFSVLAVLGALSPDDAGANLAAWGDRIAALGFYLIEVISQSPGHQLLLDAAREALTLPGPGLILAPGFF